jgi:hypothetical protein
VSPPIVPQPDGEAIADAVRERYQHLTRRHHKTTLDDLDEVVRLQRLLMAHIVYIQEVRYAPAS